MANLEEITPEENFIYKKEICRLVEILLKNFDNLNIIYKNFSGSYEDDYFTNYFGFTQGVSTGYTTGGWTGSTQSNAIDKNDT